MPRPTVKLLLLDGQDRLLLIHSRDPSSGRKGWYPVGGGLEPGETLQEAAAREVAEETGLAQLPVGALACTRDHAYSYDRREVGFHEDWLLHRVGRFRPAPAALTDYESRSSVGFHWWSVEDLVTTAATVFPPRLGEHLSSHMKNGARSIPSTSPSDAPARGPLQLTLAVGSNSGATSDIAAPRPSWRQRSEASRRLWRLGWCLSLLMRADALLCGALQPLGAARFMPPWSLPASSD